MKIEEIDKNFAAENKIPEDIVFYDCFQEPIVINGLYLENDEKVFTRLPLSYKEKTDNEGVKRLLHHTSGGRLRFATSSPYLAVYVELPEIVFMGHMPSTGHSGVDVYVAKRGEKDYHYIKTFIPGNDENHPSYTGFCEFEAFDSYEEREVMLNLPLYNGVKSVKIGIKKGTELYAPVNYSIEKPVYYYGSSITQGGCASRPGNTYMGHISRWLDCDFVNLGFSGNAKGEKEMAEYIATKEMSAFVLDYDANAPDSKHLENTHYPFYKTVREKNKDIPIILLSFPRFDKKPGFLSFASKVKSKDQTECNQIIMRTYLKAVDEGDKNVYYIDGSTLFGIEDQDSCTVDNCHPNDLGFYKMAKTVYPVIKKALQSLR